MIKKFIHYYKPHLGLFILDLVCALIVAGIDLVFPQLTQIVLKNYLGNFSMILIISAIILSLFLLKFYLGYVIGYYGHLMGIRLESDMRRDLYKKFQTLDYQYYDNKKTGELMSHLTTYLSDISEMSHHVPEDLFISLIMFIGSFILLFKISKLLTLIVFIFLIFVVIYSLTRRKKMLKGFRLARNEQGELNSITASSLSGIHLTKAFNNEELEIEKFEKVNIQYLKARATTFKEIGLYSTGNDFFMNLAHLAVLFFGAYFVIKGEISIIELTTYFLYVHFLTRPIARITNSVEQLQNGFSGIEKFFNIMEIKPRIVSSPNAIIKEEFIGDIKFANVSFQYEESETRHVLNNFNLHIKAGKKVAIVGKTGVGKSTISKLIPRFYDVNEGSILIDDINIKDYNLDNLRSAIGHVQQDVIIFYGTIKENILYGKYDATDEEIIKAAKKAHIHDFITSLDDGYDSLVGERGINLSGGQKQRIAIARIFLKNPKILILDEATSSLDNITEQQIQASLDELAIGRTTIIIAHRLSTIKKADEIIVLGEDGIIESGRHEDLIKKGGYYAELYEATIMI